MNTNIEIIIRVGEIFMNRSKLAKIILASTILVLFLVFLVYFK